jgi:hypothetical protein
MLLELGVHVVVQGQGRPHTKMLTAWHRDVKATVEAVSDIGKQGRARPAYRPRGGF